jgi:L-iditol 2-dehydrogenase
MYYNNQDVRVEEMPVPEIGPGELLLRVEASGICGSDVMEWYRVQRAPLVLGHEVAGAVVQVGEGVDRFTEGDRLVVTHHVPCNACHYCLSGHHTVCETLRVTNFEPGGFSEFLKLPAINVDRGVFRVPAGWLTRKRPWRNPWPASTGANAGPICNPAKACWCWAAALRVCFTSTWPGLWAPVK